MTANPAWRVTTARLLLEPVSWADRDDLIAMKTDPRAFAMMLGGVRTPEQATAELATEIAAWGAHGYGIWTIRGQSTNAFLGITGLEDRPDGRGIALRYGHDRISLSRIIAIARADNFAYRTVLGAIGMTESDSFSRNGVQMLVYESII